MELLINITHLTWPVNSNMETNAIVVAHKNSPITGHIHPSLNDKLHITCITHLSNKEKDKE